MAFGHMWPRVAPLQLFFYSAPQCSQCKRCIATAFPSVCPSVTRRYCVKTTAPSTVHFALSDSTRRPASANRTARRQFQATGQPVNRTHASDAMTSRLPRYEAKCVQRRCFQCRPVPLRSDIKGTELPPANILIPLERQLIALQLCC